MPDKVFRKSFTQQAPLPEASLAAAEAILTSARLHRYNVAPGESSETERLEAEFAAWQGATYCLALGSGGQALQIALRAVGVRPGDPVLTNAFTLAPVPGAIAAVGGVPCLVDITGDLVIDLDDLSAKAEASGARVLLLSLMRGHLPDMAAVAERCAALGLTLVEDCAHTMGARWDGWDGRRSGSFGAVGCFSTQTYKHLNSGEGGLLTTDDPDLAARATVMSGSYMLHDRHGAGPDPRHFEDAELDMPNLSARMDNLRAAILRPQLQELEAHIAAWNRRYQVVASRLRESDLAHLPERRGAFVGSSIQFLIPGISSEAAGALLDRLAARGVEVKWFGAAAPAGYTSMHRHWRYVTGAAVPNADRVLGTLFDMRIPLSFSEADCALIGEILVEEVARLGETVD